MAVRSQKYEIYEYTVQESGWVTSSEGIYTVLKQQFKLDKFGEESIMSLRKTNGCTQTATMRLLGKSRSC